MTPNPILKVLSTLKKHNVQALLIGGQACIIYGATEFSRDSDFVILSSSANIDHLKKALNELNAELIYVPPLELPYLDRGHACHFRCHAHGVENLRVDLISQLRGCEPFMKLWERRNTIKLQSGEIIDILSLHDLVQCKKTQRDKDWFMLKRLVENDILLNQDNPSSERIGWWLKECRDPNFLIDLAKKYLPLAQRCVQERPLLSWALSSEKENLQKQLDLEEMLERQKDVEYWTPLRHELEQLRHKKS